MGTGKLRQNAEGYKFEWAESEEPPEYPTGTGIGPGDSKQSSDKDASNHFDGGLRAGVHAGADEDEGGEKTKNSSKEKKGGRDRHARPGSCFIFPAHWFLGELNVSQK